MLGSANQGMIHPNAHLQDPIERIELEIRLPSVEHGGHPVVVRATVTWVPASNPGHCCFCFFFSRDGIS